MIKYWIKRFTSISGMYVFGGLIATIFAAFVAVLVIQWFVNYDSIMQFDNPLISFIAWIAFLMGGKMYMANYAKHDKFNGMFNIRNMAILLSGFPALLLMIMLVWGPKEATVLRIYLPYLWLSSVTGSLFLSSIIVMFITILIFLAVYYKKR